MKRFCLPLLLAALAIAAGPLSAQRVAVVEHFTQWNCGYCPPENTLLDQLYPQYSDNLAIIRYHGWWPGANNDPFYLANVSENNARISYYGVNYVPWDVVDGNNGSTAVEETRIAAAVMRPSPIQLRMSVAYDTLARSGTISWAAKAVSAVTATGLRLHTAIVEDDIYYASAGTNGEHTFNQVMRDMIPDANGTSITLASTGDSVVGTTPFALAPGWNAERCELVLFVQSTSLGTATASILQGAKAVFAPSLVQQRYTLTEVGDNDGFYEPLEHGQVVVSVQNNWTAGSDASVTLTCNDPAVSVVSGALALGAMAAGDTANNAGAPFDFAVNAPVESPWGRRVTFYITKQIYGSFFQRYSTKVDSFKLWVGEPTTIFSEDFESGLGQWVVGRISTNDTLGVNWDTTGAAPHSGAACATDSRAGNYANGTSRYLMSATGINLTQYGYAVLTWWDHYSTEPNLDFCRPALSTNGGSSWSTIPQYSGTQPSWQLKTVDLTNYCPTAGSFKLRYLLTSSANNTYDGWYIDDVVIRGYPLMGVAADPVPPEARPRLLLLPCFPNPTRGAATIRFQLERGADVTLGVYDVSGRLVRTEQQGRRSPGGQDVRWDGRDCQGRPCGSGLYFYRLTAGAEQRTGRLTLIR